MHPAASAAPSDKRWPSERFHCIQGCREKAAGHVGETAVRRRRKDASQQQRNVQRAAAASKARETGACGTNCRHRAPGQLQLQTGRPEERSCVDIDKVGEKREVMADNFLIVVYYPHPGTRKPTIFGDFRFPNYPLFDNFHCRLLLRCPVLSSHHRLSMSLPLQHHTQMLRRYH